MKNLILLLILLTSFSGAIFSQSCLPEGITFSTQAQVDSFKVNYPGCSIIEGDVRVHGNEIEDLAGLSIIDSIFGYLAFEGTQHISDMTGLGNLKYIGRGFYLDDVSGLLNFTGLDNLNTINGSLKMEYCDALNSLVGLENLVSIDGSLEINETWALHSLSGLENLNTIGKDLSIGSWWSGNDSLASLNGLNNLNFIGGNLEIVFNDILTDLTGLENLTYIGGDLEIIENPMLTNLVGLENINDSSISRIWIHDNPLLTECDIQSICEYLGDIHEMIEVYNNGQGCNNPHEIADSCGFTLSCLPYGNYFFGSQAEIDSFPSYYPDCHNLPGYTHIESEDITHLDSLYGIDTINGSLSICNNSNLSGLNGLENLKFIQGSFSIGFYECGGNPGLTDLEGLNNLARVEESLNILYNDGLTSLSGLDSLILVGPGSVVCYNGMLSICSTTSICNLISQPGISLIFGSNAPGCNSIIEVEAGCEAGEDESAVDSWQLAVGIYPNPSSTQITIETKATTTKFQISIFNPNGQEVIRKQITEPMAAIDISHLPQGLYFVKLASDESVKVLKFVKE
jgi:hypothetical protein